MTHKLYGGTVELSFNADKHKYTVNGNLVDSVTQILKIINKPLLVPWAAKMTAEYVNANLKPGVGLDELQIQELCKSAKNAHRMRSQTSADLGGIAHSWMEDYFAGKQPATPYNPELRNITEAFLRFTRQHVIEPITLEKKLYSIKHNVAGTTDLIAVIDGELTIADYKTSKSGIYAEGLIQLGAYDLCYTEENEFLGSARPITRHMIINCKANGELNIANSSNVQQNREAFLYALGLANSLSGVDTDCKSVTVKI